MNAAQRAALATVLSDASALIAEMQGDLARDRVPTIYDADELVNHAGLALAQVRALAFPGGDVDATKFPVRDSVADLQAQRDMTALHERRSA